MQCGLINKEREPFSVRDKGFWDVFQAKKLLEPKFTKNLGHEPDGLIFQPSADVSIFLIYHFYSPIEVSLEYSLCQNKVCYENC